MKRANALAILTKSKPALVQQFGVTRLSLFGLTARNMARTKSDVDILVGFDGPGLRRAISVCNFASKICSAAQSIW